MKEEGSRPHPTPAPTSRPFRVAGRRVHPGCGGRAHQPSWSLLLLADADVQTERAGPSPLGRGCRHLNSGGEGVGESKVGAAATARGVCVCVCARGVAAPLALCSDRRPTSVVSAA